jgi:hypothetical protein
MDGTEETNVADFKLTELNHWVDGEGTSYPAHGYDVYVQRLSVYLQRNMEDSGLTEDEWEDYPDPAESSDYIRFVEERKASITDAPPCDIVKKFDNSKKCPYVLQNSSNIISLHHDSFRV